MTLSRLSKLAAAVAGIITAGNAYALPPAETLDPANLVVYVTGGGAADGNFRNVVRALLDPATTDTYLFNGAQNNFFAISGTIPDSSVLGAAFSGPRNVVFYKRTQGAAFTSTTVPDAEEITHLDISQILPENYNATTRIGNVTGTGGEVGGPGTGLKKVASDAGYSDTPINLFASPINVSAGESPITQAQLNRLVTLPINAALHGVAVTKALRDALQQQQGLVVGDESEANVPSLSKAAIASIYQGRVNLWTQLVHNGVRLEVPAGYSSTVQVVPRSRGAAIQASVNARILNAPSNPNAPGPAGQKLIGQPLIWEANLPADTDAILHGLDTGTAFSWRDGNGVVRNVPAGTRRLAIGSQSTERNTGTLAGPKDTLNYRFIKIDGVAATLRNAYNGTYPLTLEAVVIYRSASAPSPLVGEKKALVDYLAGQIASPTVLGASNANFFHGYGQTGYLALSTNGYAVGAFNPALPVTGYTYGGDIGRPPVRDTTSVGGTPLAPDLITN